MSLDRLSVLGGTYNDPAAGSARVRFRRALTLTLMTLVMPGSAQLVMGNKRLGRMAIRVWLGAITVVVLTLLVGLVSRTSLFSVMTNPFLTSIFRLLLMAAAILWVGLLLDAWRLGAPLDLRRGHFLTMTGLNAGLCCVTAGVLFFGAHILSVQNNFIGAVFAAETVSQPHDGRYNVLLLGGDSGKGRDGLRPDSLTVASIDQDTGRTVLVGLPRNLQDIPFPAGSVMDKEWPDGFNCDDCYLNSINTWANDNAKLFDTKAPGLGATKSAVEEITGLKINYYALVNMHGFAKLVDAVGGVTINVKERTAIGGIGSPIRGYIEAGKQKLSGDRTLWYSRSRIQNDDFSRMGRQKCVMNAMLQQLSPQKVLFNVEKIAESSRALLSTDIPAKDLDVFMDLALKARGEKVSTVSLVPPVIYTGNPDFKKIKRIIGDAVAKSEGTKASSGGLLAAELKPVRSPAESDKDPLVANATDDLAKVC